MAAGALKESIALSKKTAEHQRVPNRRLKYERELRGWSQKYVATQINAERYYVSRWETGAASPSPDYRRKLCELFGENAEELGLLAGDEAGTNGHKPDRVFREAAVFLYDPAIPPQPLAHGLVGRDELLDRVKQRLLAGESLTLSALNGLPGIGKTAMAITIAHDSRVQDYFCDGILWAGLGYQPDVISHLSRWGALLGIEPGEMAQLGSARAWADVLRAKIGLRRMLLVIDDAWKFEEALAFKVGGPGCAYLVTTRMPEIACQFAHDGATVVRELSEDDSVTLLARLAPEVVAHKPDQVRSLLRSVGGLPLALTLMGNYLRTQAYPGNGPSRRLQAALDRLQHAEKRLWLAQPQAFAECPPNLRPDMPLSLHVIIGMSYQHLDEQAQYALRALSLFPAKPNTFSEEAALAVGAVPAEVLDSLTSAGLLEGSGSGRYTLHQVIADYAQLQAADAAAEERMASFFVSYLEAHKTDYDALELESSNVLVALRAAYERNIPALLVRGVLDFVPFLEARGLYAVAEMHLKRALQAAHTLGEDAGLVSTWLHLGRVAKWRGDLPQARQAYQQGLTVARAIGHREMVCTLLAGCGEIAQDFGEYAQAETYLQEGLALVRELSDWQRMAILLKNLGEVVDSRGDHAQGEQFYLEGLELAREIGDYETMSALLQNLGVKAEWRGDYKRSEERYREALELAQKIGHKQRICAVLMNMGVLALRRKRYMQAERLYQESLELARGMGARRRISALLQNLGELEGIRGKYIRAEAYLRESLEMAIETGDRWLISETLNECGELNLRQQDGEAAHAAFEQALTIARDMGAAQLVAVALYGFARVAAARGDQVEARRLGEESQALFKHMGHEKGNQVEQWLAGWPVL